MWVLFAIYTAGTSLTVTTQEFDTQRACSNAGTILTAMAEKALAKGRIEIFCTPK